MSPEAQEFYFAAARLVAAIRTAFPDPLGAVPCPALPFDHDELPTGKSATWWAFAMRDDRLDHVARYLLPLVPGLWDIRETLSAAGIMVRDKPVLGPGKDQFKNLLTTLLERPWLSIGDDKGDTVLWMLPPNAELADQMRVAARDLAFHRAAVGEEDSGSPFADMGAAVPAHVAEYRRLNALYEEEEIKEHSERAADEVNKRFGLAKSKNTYRAEHIRWSKREAAGWKPGGSRRESRK